MEGLRALSLARGGAWSAFGTGEFRPIIGLLNASSHVTFEWET